MDRFEHKLKSLIDQPIQNPDSDLFLERLHETIRHRQVVRNRIISSVSIVIASVVLIVGLFKYLVNNNESLYQEEAIDFPLFSDVYDEDLNNSEWIVDDAFVLDVLDYLIQESDLVGLQLDIVEDLYDFGILEDLEIKSLEGQS